MHSSGPSSVKNKMWREDMALSVQAVTKRGLATGDRQKPIIARSGYSVNRLRSNRTR